MKKEFFILTILVALCAVALPAISQNLQNQKDQMRFQGLDRNKDGRITRNEWRGNDQSFANEDCNRDGVLSGNEVRSGARRPDDLLSSARSEASFRDQDRNNNGFITRNEWGGDRQAFDRLDANRNGSLSRDEFLGAGYGRSISNSRGIPKIISSGTEFAVRSNETIDSKTAAVGQHFSAIIERDILDSTGNLAIPKGSDAELVIRQTEGGSMTTASELVLDVDSVTVAGIRYLVSTEDMGEKGREGIGANRRTGVMVGGGAGLGALIGAIAGGGKGAAIGAGVGAAAGAAGQILTKGNEVRVPAETVLNFKLEQDLRLEPTS